MGGDLEQDLGGRGRRVGAGMFFAVPHVRYLGDGQWRNSIGHGGTCSHFYTAGGTVSRRTANKKLTKLY